MSTYGLSVLGADLKSLAQTAQAADAAGFDAVWASEFYSRSGSISMAAMANSTQNCRIGSSILYGVGRSPLVLATEARDLDELSNGRLVLGIGNGTKRMMGDWHGVPDTSAPALRMEELVMLLRRIWNLHEGPIHHEGRFYRMNLTPTGDVGPSSRPIPIVTAGVRPRMCEAAGRVADGLAGHPLFTTTYVEEVVRPAIARGAAHTGRDPNDVEIISMVMCAIHDDAGSAEVSSANRSPSSESLSEPRPWFSEIESTASSASTTCSTLRRVASASSSTVASRPSFACSSADARLSLIRRSWTWTGMRIVLDWFATARWQAWRIHHVAYVENL